MWDIQRTFSTAIILCVQVVRLGLSTSKGWKKGQAIVCPRESIIAAVPQQGDVRVKTHTDSQVISKGILWDRGVQVGSVERASDIHSSTEFRLDCKCFQPL